jgi:hypothetical protein
MDVIIQTQLYFAGLDDLIIQIILAGPNRKDLSYGLYDIAELPNIRIGPHIFRTILNPPSGDKNLWERLVGDSYVWIGLIVSQANIVTRFMFLY